MNSEKTTPIHDCLICCHVLSAVIKKDEYGAEYFKCNDNGCEYYTGEQAKIHEQLRKEYRFNLNSQYGKYGETKQEIIRLLGGP